MRRVRLGDRSDGDAGRLQLTLDARRVGVGGRGDRLLDMHLKHKVSAAAKVKAEVDAAGDRVFQRRRSDPVGNAEDAEDADGERSPG
jgi:hypothetical protein